MPRSALGGGTDFGGQPHGVRHNRGTEPVETTGSKLRGLGAICRVPRPFFASHSRRKVSNSMANTASWVVHKFGGSSVADAECFRRVAEIVESQPPGPQGIVLSACRGVT